MYFNSSFQVGGSFHIAPGKSFTINHVHVHDVQPYSSSVFNTTHVIQHLSFGTDIKSANTAPLDGVKGLAKEGKNNKKYFLILFTIKHFYQVYSKKLYFEQTDSTIHQPNS